MYVDKEETDSTWIICRRYSGYLCWVCFLIGAFSFVGGLSITNGSASAYFSGAYSSQKYSRAKGYLNILKTKEVSPHAYVICGNNIGKISISSFLKKRKNYKVVKYAKKSDYYE